MEWIPEFYDPEILKDIEAIEQEIVTKPGFSSFRSELVDSLRNDHPRLKGFTAQQLIEQADTFEELIVMKDYLQARFAGDHVWWDDYHKRRIELAMLPSNYGTIEGKARFALPVSPQRFKRSNIKGLRGIGVKRNLAGQLFTRRQLQGLDPVQLSKEGLRFENFLNAQRPPSKSYFAFDLETTGLLKQLAYKETGSSRGITSLGFSFRNSEGFTREGMSLVDIKNGPYYGEFIEETILPRHRQMMSQSKADLGLRESSIFKKRVTEDKIIKQFIAGLKSDRKAALMGYNIEQFDIPYLKMIAKRHGLEKELTKVLKGREVIDVGHYAKAFLSEKLGSEYIGWQEGMFKELKLNPTGWKQQALAHAFNFKHSGMNALSDAAHTPFFDVKMTEHIYNTLTKDSGKEASRLWNEAEILQDGTRGLTGKQRYEKALGSLDQKLIGISELDKMTIRKGEETFLNLPSFMIPKEPRSASFLDRLEGKTKLGVPKKVASPSVNSVRDIFSNIPDRNIAKLLKNNKNAAILSKSARFAAIGAAVSIVAPGQGASNLIGGYGALAAYQVAKTKTNKATLGIAAGVATYGIIKGLNSLAFSGRDDNYNHIEGLKHGGAAQTTRLRLTEFGSGYQGQKLSIYNQEIDPQIQEFRHRWLSTPTQKKLLKEKMEAAGESVEQIRDLKASEMSAAGEFQKIELDDYNWSFEDPDTLMLKSKGSWNFFEDPVAIRMTGIDSPEISHSNDALDWTRYQQDQPYGQEATKKAKEQWEGKEGLSVLIDPERQTYGRYLGILKEEGKDKSVNVQMIEQGIAAALPWGDAGSDMISRKTLIEAESGAIAEERGMWKEDYYKRYLDITQATGQRITFTSFSDLSRLGQNYNLAAAQKLMSRDDVEYEPWMGRYIGSKLRKSHGPIDETNRFTAKDDAYNTIEGLHPGSQSMGAESIREHSSFGSGWQDGLQIGGMAAGVIAGGVALGALGSWGWKKFGSDVVMSTQESGGARSRRKKQERIWNQQESWIHKIAPSKYKNMGFFGGVEKPVDYVSTGNGGKFPAMGNKSKGSWSANIRESLTEFKSEFASRWDPTVKLAKKLFGDSEDAISQLRSLPQFKEAMSMAMKKEGTLLGVGATAKSYARTGSFEYQGATHSFDFVSKELRSIDDMITGVEGKYPAMDKSHAEIFYNLARNDSLKRETNALKKLEWMGKKNRAPSYYGETENAIMMEKFNIVNDFRKTPMRAEEGENLTSFMKEAHRLNLSHTDLHGENMVRVMTRQGGKDVEEAAVLDWGMASRLTGNDPHMPLTNQVLVDKMSSESFGRSITLDEYSKLADLKRIDAFAKGEERGSSHHLGINALMSVPGDEATKMVQREAVNEVLVFGGGKRLASRPVDLSGPGSVVSESQAWKSADFFGSVTKNETIIDPPVLTGSATSIENIRNPRVELISAINHMKSAPSLPMGSKTYIPPYKRELAYQNTMLHSKESTEVAIPMFDIKQSKASETLRTTSDKVCRVPFQSAQNAGSRHRYIASKTAIEY